MSAATKITNVCEIAEAYGKSIGLAPFEIDRVVRSKSDEIDEWIVHVRFLETEPSIVEEDDNGTIIVVNSHTDEARLVEGL